MILVTGGTGLLGAHLLYKLTSEGAQVCAIYRDKSTLESVEKVFSYYSESSEALFEKIRWVQADITEVPALSNAFENVSMVYHCAADISFDYRNYNKTRQVNVVGTANVVNLCLSNKVSKLCYVSSVAAIGEDVKKPITEETHWNPENNSNNIYAITKYDAELEVWRATQEGLDAVIVNPGVIIGPGFWNACTGEIFTKVSKGFNYYASGVVGVIDVNDVVKSMVLLMNSNIRNEQFILVSENISYKDLISTVQMSVGLKGKLREVTKWQLLFYMQIERVLSFILRKKRTLYKANITSAFKQLNYDTSKVKKTIGVNFIPVVESINNTGVLFKKEQL